MKIRIEYKSAAEAERAAEKLPIACKWRVVKECMKKAYLEVTEVAKITEYDIKIYINNKAQKKENSYDK